MLENLEFILIPTFSKLEVDRNTYDSKTKVNQNQARRRELVEGLGTRKEKTN